MGCPLKNKAYNDLVEVFGEGKTLALWQKNGESTPTLEQAYKMLEPTLFYRALPVRQALNILLDTQLGKGISKKTDRLGNFMGFTTGTEAGNRKWATGAREWIKGKEDFDNLLIKISDKTGNIEFHDKTRKIQSQLSSEETPAFPELDARIKAFIESLGGEVRYVDRLVVDGKEVAGNALVDILNKIIQVANGKSKLDTLPEEAAHLAFKLLPENSILRRDMLQDIVTRPEYQEVLQEYSSNPYYQNEDGTIDLDKIANEAVGKVIAKAIVGQFQKDIKVKSLLRRLLDWLMKVFKGAKPLNAYEQIAKTILNGSKADTRQEGKEWEGDISQTAVDNYSNANKTNSGVKEREEYSRLTERVKEASKRGQYYFQLSQEEQDIAKTQMRRATPVQKKVIEEVYLNPHERLVLDPVAHVYRGLGIENPTTYTSVTTAIGGTKEGMEEYEANRVWGNAFDSILQNVISGKKRPTDFTVEGLSDEIKTEAFYFLKGLVSSWTADGTIALPQVIVADKSATPIAGSIDVLLVSPFGEMTIVDLKSSWSSILEGKYTNTRYKVGEGSLLGDASISKSTIHSIQVMTYAKLIQLMGFPVKEVRTENIKLTTDKGQVTGFTYEGAVDKALTENEVYVDKIIPTLYLGKNRLQELNDEFGTGNPLQRGIFDKGPEKPVLEDAPIVDPELFQGNLVNIFTAGKNWENTLEQLRHNTLYEVKEGTIASITKLMTDLQDMFAAGQHEKAYSSFLNIFSKHLNSIIGTLKDTDKLRDKPEDYATTLSLAKQYLNNFSPYLSASYAEHSGDTTLYNKVDAKLREANLLIIGAEESIVKELVRRYSSNPSVKDLEWLEQIIKEDKDVNKYNMWMDTIGNSGTVILENVAKLLATKRQQIRENVEANEQRFKEAGNKLAEAVGSTDNEKLFGFMYQVDSKGKRTGRIVSQRGTVYNELEYNAYKDLYYFDSDRGEEVQKEYIRRPSTPEEKQWNVDLYYIKERWRNFSQGEKRIYNKGEDAVTGQPTYWVTTEQGDYHTYSDTFLAERTMWEIQNDKGEWVQKPGTNKGEYDAWKRKTHTWSTYMKMKTVVDPTTGKKKPTGVVSQAEGWFVNKEHIVSREIAADGTDLWDTTFRKMINPTTPLEEAQSEFYIAYTQFMREMVEKLPSSAMYWFERGYIPTLKANFLQELSSSQSTGMWDTVTNQLRSFFDTSAFTNQSDVNKTGTAAQTIPIMFMGSLQSQKRLQEIENAITEHTKKKGTIPSVDWVKKNNNLMELRKKELAKITADQIHPDLVQGLMAFNRMAENFHVMSSVESTIAATIGQIKRMKFFDKNGKLIEGEKSNAYRMFNKYLDMVYYHDPTYTKDFAEVAVQKLMKATTVMNIPFNLFGTVNNKLMARLNNRLDAIGSDFFSHKAYNRQQIIYNTEVIPGWVKTLGSKKGKYGEKLAGSKYEALTSTFDMVRHAHGDESKLNLTSWGHKGYEAGEWESQSLVGNAILDSIQMRYKGSDKTLQDCSIYDAHTFNPNTGKVELIEGYKFLDKEGNVTADQELQRRLIINRIHETNDRIHGNYDPANAVMLNSTVMGKLALQFHKWLWPNFKSRFQGKKFDENLGGGMEIEGRWWGTVGFLFSEIRRLKSLSESWNSLSPHQKNNMLKDLADIGYFCLFLTAVHIIKSVAEGIPDDDPILKKFANWSQYQGSRMSQEVALFIPILGEVEGYQLVKNPFAATSSLSKFAMLLNETLQYPFLDDEHRIYQRGNFKGESKVAKRFRDVLPILREVNTITNLQTVKNFYISGK